MYVNVVEQLQNNSCFLVGIEGAATPSRVGIHTKEKWLSLELHVEEMSVFDLIIELPSVIYKIHSLFIRQTHDRYRVQQCIYKGQVSYSFLLSHNSDCSHSSKEDRWVTKNLMMHGETSVLIHKERTRNSPGGPWKLFLRKEFSDWDFKERESQGQGTQDKVTQCH